MRKKEEAGSVCAICKFYTGNIPVTVSNFKCSLGVSSLKVLICPRREEEVLKEWRRKYAKRIRR